LSLTRGKFNSLVEFKRESSESAQTSRPWGGTGTIGFATFVNPNQTFDTPTGPVIGTTVGTLNGTSSGRVINQGITFTINSAF